MSKPSSYTRARRVTIEDGNDQPLTSEIDGQRFRVDRGDTSTVDGAPVLTIDNEDVALRNAGRLTTQGDTATVEVNGEDARIDNRFGGSIEAEDTAIEVNGEDARIDNRFGGSIEAEDTAIEVNGEDARIANRFGGSIEAGDTAVQVNDEDARIVNSGTIAGGFNGISFAAEGADSGLIVNRGVITSDSRAVDIDGEDVTLINRGSILGTGDQRDGTVYADNTADDYVIRNAGSIDAGDGNQGAGISLSLGAEVDAEVVNSGIVQGRGDAAASSPLAGDGIRLSSGVDGPSTFTGDITNRGVISSEGANGTVAGIRVANGVGFEGTLTNARDGLVSGVQNGVYFGNADHDGGEFVNRGTVTSDSRAVNLDGDDLTFENRGEVLGTGNQRNGTTYIDGTGDDITVENRGTIDAGEGNTGDGLSVQVGSAAEDATNEDIDIRNSGSILGRGQAEFEGGRLTPNGSSGVRFFNGSGQPEATVTGSVVNAGTISAEVDVGFLGGLVVEDGVAFDGHIVNERGGLIAGPRNGLYIGNASHDLTIENEGRIESGSRAVNLDGDNVTFRNEGTVVGTGDQRNGTVYADATAENFVVDNLRRGLIDAGEGNDGAGVSLQIGDEIGDVVEGELNNYGTIVGRGDGIGNLAGDGIRLFSGVDGGPTTFEGNVTNHGRVVSSDDGIEINPGLTLDGDIVNRGRVDAGKGNSGSGVSVQVGSVSEDALNENITLENDGLIQGRGEGNVPAGVR
ncbi:MAG: calcium-binding protein, partial [Alphaproteobacteria bacterium]|nr:calcium-binding protein [Alphaproteobacteria bacterium]